MPGTCLSVLNTRFSSTTSCWTPYIAIAPLGYQFDYQDIVDLGSVILHEGTESAFAPVTYWIHPYVRTHTAKGWHA